MAIEWAKGTGQYSGGVFTVYGVTGELLVFFSDNARVGRGGYGRMVRREKGNLIVPAHGDLPEIVLKNGLTGFWELGEDRRLIFSETLPEGGVERQPFTELPQDAAPESAEFELTESQLAAALAAHIAGRLKVVKAPNRALIFQAMFVPDPSAPVGTLERLLADALDVPYAKTVISRLRAGAPEATDVVFNTSIFRDRIDLDSTASKWVCTTDGEERVLCPLGTEAQIDLRQLATEGTKLLPVGLNPHHGEITRVVGLLGAQDTAYCGLFGDPLKLLMPMGAGTNVTIQIVVAYEVGYEVFGLTTGRRYNEPGYVVPPMGKKARRYFVFPDGERVVEILPDRI